MKSVNFLIIFFIFLYTCSCASLFSTRKYTYEHVDVRAMPYIKSFEREAGFKIPFVRVAFVSSFGKKHEKKKTIGLCDKVAQQIYLPGYKWDDMDEYQREELVFHEIGHCVLGKKHDKRKIKDSDCPYSIMHPKVIPTKCYKKYRRHYINQLLQYDKPRKLRYKEG